MGVTNHLLTGMILQVRGSICTAVFTFSSPDKKLGFTGIRCNLRASAMKHELVGTTNLGEEETSSDTVDG